MSTGREWGEGDRKAEAYGGWVVASVGTWDPLDWVHLRNQMDAPKNCAIGKGKL